MGQPGQKLTLIFFSANIKVVCARNNSTSSWLPSVQKHLLVLCSWLRIGRGLMCQVTTEAHSKDPVKESLWQYWLLRFKCQMNFLLKKNPLSTLCQVIGKWTVRQLANDIDRVPCSPLAPDCRHWCCAKPSSSEGLYGGRPTFFVGQSTLFIDLWFFMTACHTTLVKS